MGQLRDKSYANLGSTQRTSGAPDIINKYRTQEGALGCSTGIEAAARPCRVYRHDKDGRKFVYHVEAHYGDNGRATRADAMNYGREIVTPRRIPAR
jgi:hypothetical protein